MATTPNQIDGNFHQIAIADATGNVTGIQVANAAGLQVGGGTSGQVLMTNGSGTLSWSSPTQTYGSIVKTTTSGFNGMMTLMADGRLYLTRGSSTNTYDCYYDTVFAAALTDGFFGVEATHQIQQPVGETGKIIDAGLYCTSAYMLMDNGNLYTWGYNAYGALGLGDTVNRFTPTLAATTVTAVYTDNTNSNRTSGYNKLIIKKTDGKIYGCGYNAWGQLGIGNTTQQNSFVEITGAGVNPKSVWNMGGYVGCLIVQKADGTVVVSGYNGYGSLGNGTSTNILSLTPVPAWNNGDATMVLQQVTGGFGYVDTSAANHTNTFMWFSNSTTDLIKGAGANNWGSLGNGTTTDSTVPVTITIPTSSGRITKFSGMGGGPLAMHALTASGDFYSWGYNGVGTMGNGTTTNVLTPTKTTTGVLSIVNANMSQPSNYEYYSVVIVRKADGYYACGRNGQGQCGVGNTTANITTFTKMRFPDGIVIQHLGKCATTNNIQNWYAIDQLNRWWCWGSGSYWGLTNQQGNNTVDTYPSPWRVNPYNIIMDGGWA